MNFTTVSHIRVFSRKISSVEGAWSSIGSRGYSLRDCAQGQYLNQVWTVTMCPLVGFFLSPIPHLFLVGNRIFVLLYYRSKKNA